MRRAVQQLKSTGELERYNSLRARERNEEQRIEEQLLDITSSNVRADGMVPVPHFKSKAPLAEKNVIQSSSNVKVVKTVTSMIDKKKVIMENVSIKSTTINHKGNFEIETTTTKISSTTH
jgi:hypothetical protein